MTKARSVARSWARSPLLLPLLLLLHSEEGEVGAVASSRDDSPWMINVTYDGAAAGSAGFVPFSSPELSELADKAANWGQLAQEHVFWGQAFSQVIWADANRSKPAYFDDVGDTACWTGTLLAALAHEFSAVEAGAANATLSAMRPLIDFFDTATTCTSAKGYMPRTLGRKPPAGAESDDAAWQSWQAYFGNGELPDPSHNVWACEADDADDGGAVWLWQGDSSRDMYLGTLFGLASVLLRLPSGPPAATEAATDAASLRAQALAVFERLFDKLSGDDFWILPPFVQPGQLPVRPTPGLRAAFLRAALTANPDKYYGRWAGDYYGRWLPEALATDMLTPPHRSGYYGNNLLSMTWYVIAALELADGGSANEEAQAAVVRKVGRLLDEYAPHLQANLNAYMAAVNSHSQRPPQPYQLRNGGWSGASSLNATADCADPALPAAIASATLWDHPPPPDQVHAVDRSHCSSSGGDDSDGVLLSHGASAGLLSASHCYYGPDVPCAQSCNCSTTALLVRDRPQSEFLWQVDPTKLAGGSDRPPDSPETNFGGAFLAPYWVMRVGGLLSAD